MRPVGINGPIRVDLSINADADRRGGTLSAKQAPLKAKEVRALKADGFYANVHSEMFPAGEIRGQLIRR